MAVTPQPGWEVDPNNANAVRKIGTVTDSAPLPGIAYASGAMGSYNTDQGNVMMSEGEAKAKGLIPGTTTPAPAGGTASPSDYYPRYTPAEKGATDYLSTFQAPKTADELRTEKTTAAQGRIDALNKYYDSLVTTQNDVNAGRTRGTNAVSILSGLAGSTEANAADTKTSELNARDVGKINNERAVAINSVLSGIETAAIEEARQSRLEARQSAQDILAARTARQTQAVDQIKTLAASGVTFDGLKNTDPNSYDYLVRNAGGEQILNALFTLNRPKDDIVSSQVLNGKYIVAYKNPLTNKITMSTIDLGLPEGFSKAPVDAGDRLLFTPDNWDGDVSKLVAINKGLTPKDKQEAATKANANNGLNTGAFKYGTPEYTKSAIKDSAQYGNKRLVAGEIKNIQASKRALASLELYSQALNGTLDKSVSTEVFGEGTGVIKGRLRTLASQWGGDPNAAAINAIIQGIVPTVARGIFQEVGVLTDQDIANYKKVVPDINKPENANKLIEMVLLKTLERSYADTLLTAAQNQTNVSNFADEYDNIVNRLKKMGAYSDENSTAGKKLSKDGQSFDASALTPEEYQQAISDGYVEQ